MARMTNRQLAQWLALGKGQVLSDHMVLTTWAYTKTEADKTVLANLKIRGWFEYSWREPELEPIIEEGITT